MIFSCRRLNDVTNAHLRGNEVSEISEIQCKRGWVVVVHDMNKKITFLGTGI